MPRFTPHPQRPVSDEELVGRTRRGDAAAFGDLYDRHIVSAYGLARAICADGAAAERAVEQTFLEIARGEPGVAAPRGEPAAWLLSRVFRQAITEAHASNAPPGRLAGLPAGQAEIVALARFGGLSHQQIARQLDIPSGVVKRLMRIALQALAPAA